MVVCDSIAGFAKYSLNEMITNKPKAFSSSTLSKIFFTSFFIFCHFLYCMFSSNKIELLETAFDLDKNHLNIRKCSYKTKVWERFSYFTQSGITLVVIYIRCSLQLRRQLLHLKLCFLRQLLQTIFILYIPIFANILHWASLIIMPLRCSTWVNRMSSKENVLHIKLTLILHKIICFLYPCCIFLDVNQST